MSRNFLSGRCRIGLMLAALAVATAVLPASIVAAAPKSRPVVYDCDEYGVGGACDMVGEHVGDVRYRQTKDGALTVRVSVSNLTAGTTYQVLLLCGPVHGHECGRALIGEFTIDQQGTGHVRVTVPLSVLSNDLNGPNERTDRIDLVNLSQTTILVAGGINYRMPGQDPTSPSEWTRPSPKR